MRNAPYVDNSYKWAGGGFLSNVQDLVKFGNAMLFSYQRKTDPLEKNQPVNNNNGCEGGVARESSKPGQEPGVSAKLEERPGNSGDPKPGTVSYETNEVGTRSQFPM